MQCRMEANLFADKQDAIHTIGQSPRQNVFLSYKIFIYDHSWPFVIIRVKKNPQPPRPHGKFQTSNFKVSVRMAFY